MQVACGPKRFGRPGEREVDIGAVFALTPVGLTMAASKKDKLTRADALAIRENEDTAGIALASVFRNQGLAFELLAHDALVLQQDKLLLDIFTSLNAHNSNQVISSSLIC